MSLIRYYFFIVFILCSSCGRLLTYFKIFQLKKREFAMGTSFSHPLLVIVICFQWCWYWNWTVGFSVLKTEDILWVPHPVLQMKLTMLSSCRRLYLLLRKKVATDCHRYLKSCSFGSRSVYFQRKKSAFFFSRSNCYSFELSKIGRQVLNSYHYLLFCFAD